MDKPRVSDRSRVISFVKIISDSSKRECGRVIDISSKGMRVRSKNPFRTDRPFHFSMLMPNINFREKVIRFDASVIWSDESAVDGYYEAGLQIESVSEKDRSLIEQFINDSSYRDRWIQVDECFSQEH